MNISETIIGIDLGTTNSVVSVLDGSVPKTLEIDNAKLLPSVVSSTQKGFVVGQVAKNMAILEPESTCLSIKRKMGQDITITLGENKMRPEEISSLILQKIKESVIEQLGLNEKNVRAVITVPAYFTEEQREATKQSAELADFTVERIINEPTAASLAFGLNKLDDKIFAVYDLGGGTFDISIVENCSGIIEVRATTGDNMLGGDDFDKDLADFIWKQFLEKNDINIERTKKIDARLRKIAEETKIKLSGEPSVDIQENFFVKDDDKVYHLQLVVERTQFENLIRGYIDKTIDHLNQALSDADLEVEDIEGVILVGGSSKIPVVTEKIEEALNVTATLIDFPDECVSHGATIQGAIINHVDVDTILVDITPHSLGIRILDKKYLEERLFNSFNGDNTAEDEDKKFLTGIIIPKNTPLPTKRSNRFSAVMPFQEGYEIKVYQGEHNNPKDNQFIGEAFLNVENPIEHGGIEVEFSLDLNGILKVQATETTKGDKVHATFKSSRGKKLMKSNFEKTIIANDEASMTIVNRAENVMKKDTLNHEDKEELTVLLKKYKDEKVNNVASSNIEEDLLDLLYYLEDQ